MCGIFGHYVRARGASADPALIERMAKRLVHRGPDGFGTYHAGRLAMGAGRLAIIDLSAPAGPIFNEDRTVSVVFNGEIYNYRELRTELERAGHHFRTATDTEVIVHGYEQWGSDVVKRLRGMFALCLYSEHDERMLLTRDRAGEKPLYYAFLDDEFIFTSEIKALFEHPHMPTQVNASAMPLYLTFGYVPPPQTLFAGIEKLAPGELMILERGVLVHRERYWQPYMDTTGHDFRYADAVRQVRTAVTEAVETRMISDVPVGAFLSGGLDSTAVVALMAQATPNPVRTFTVGFDFGADAKNDQKFNVDMRYARVAADHYRTDHHSITIKVDDRLTDLLPRLVWHMDEPVAQQSIIQTAYVSALARRMGVPVLLSGDAGDELFAGYTHYRADRLLESYQSILPPLRNRVLSPLLSRVQRTEKLIEKSRIISPAARYLAWMRMIDPAHLPGLLQDQALARSASEHVSAIFDPILLRPKTAHFADRIAYASFNLWIAEDSNMRVDKMSMAMSVEARAPLEDHPLVDLAFRLPLEYKLRGGDFKRVFKDAVRDLIPAAILKRPKWGFVPPTSEWLRTVFRPLVERYMSPERLHASGIFNARQVCELVEAHRAKRSYELWTIWPILVFQLWHALYIERDLTVAPLTATELV
ncbi:MAG: asparagine synthase (glutamine-hydrolyzing) [Anaerolineae bacterium]|nr:asparagine synthase (glutamine-hydrolyzing) [Anaerolineae bacterium]